ncbi:Os01g0800250, partial [Oryza sativa Japonica Group]
MLSGWRVLRLTKWLQRMTLAPLPMRCLMVGMAAMTRVSSVMFWLASRGTLRSARKSTRFPSRSAAARSPTLFFAIVATARARRLPADAEAARRRDETWIASRGSVPRAAKPSERAVGHGEATPARGSG